MKPHITKGSVFDDLGFTAIEAENLKIRATLMNAIEEEILVQGLAQQQTAKILGVTQPRISDLMRGKIQLFTVDMLIAMLTKLHVSVAVVIDNRLAA